MEQRREGAALIAGGITGGMLGAAVASLLASRPAQAAPDQTKLDYLISLAEAQLTVDATLTQQLTELHHTMKGIREVDGIDFAFDPLRYIVWKLRSGEAYADRGSIYQLVAGGATFTVTQVMPEGYVWIGIRESVVVSQNGVFEFTRMVDSESMPWMYVPRVASGEFNWAETLPFGLVIKNAQVAIYTNHDAANQWVIAPFYGIFLREDVWEADSRVMDLVATKYSTPPEVNFE